MAVILEALPARHGDCVMLHYGPDDERELVLIDGGPPGVWNEVLKKRLLALREGRDLLDHEPLPIRLVMVSHIDDDHIRGILELTDHLREQREFQQPPSFKVEELWHNSFDDIVGNAADALKSASTAAVAGASHGGFPKFNLAGHAEAVIASVPQGRRLRNNAKALGIEVNRLLSGAPLIAPTGAPLKTELADDLSLEILGPDQERLDALHKEWDEILEKKGLDQPEGQAEAAAFVDRSVFNLSSLVVLATGGSKRALLTGDARGDHILKYLESAGMLEDGKAHFDVLKLPHHGSNRNVEPVFFERLTADHYVVSGDGRHHNPEIETIEMIRDAREGAAYTIHLTYPVASFKDDYPKAELSALLADLGAQNPEVRVAHCDPEHPRIEIEL